MLKNIFEKKGTEKKNKIVFFILEILKIKKKIPFCFQN
jgi:hypothetical protein